MRKIEVFIADSSYLASEGLKTIIGKNDDFILVMEKEDSEHLAE